jgi:cyanophycinase
LYFGVTNMGKIILIGGKVDIGMRRVTTRSKAASIKNIRPQILMRFLKEMRGANSKIEIITAATKNPHKVGREYQQALKNLGCKKVQVMNISTPRAADRKGMLERLEKCDGVMFTGGDQTRISKALLDTEFLVILKRRFVQEKDFMVSGTSAGAMAMSESMIARGNPSEALRKGRVKLKTGLGLLPRVIIDTHFVNRGRFGRLMEAVAYYPKRLGIGLGEDTAVFLKKPNHVETIGTNLVVLIDGSKMTYKNIVTIAENEALCIEDMKLHALPQGHVFNIPKRKIYKKILSIEKEI